MGEQNVLDGEIQMVCWRESINGEINMNVSRYIRLKHIDVAVIFPVA